MSKIDKTAEVEIIKLCSLGQGKGLTISNVNKFIVRHFEDQALSGLKPNSDFVVSSVER